MPEGRPDQTDPDCSHPDCRPEFFCPLVRPNTDPEFCTCGRIAGGIFRILRSCESHFFVRMLKISELSIVPKQISPFSARRRRPLTLSSSHWIFVPEK